MSLPSTTSPACGIDVSFKNSLLPPGLTIDGAVPDAYNITYTTTTPFQFNVPVHEDRCCLVFTLV